MKDITPIRAATLGALAAAALAVACQGPTRIDRPLGANAPELVDAPPAPGPAPGPSYTTERTYYDGQIYLWQFPTQKSKDMQELIIGCWNGGIAPARSNAPTTVSLYAIHLPGATLHWCPGQPTVGLHDHLLSAIPGSPGYTSHWHLYGVFPGPSFDPANSPMPITSIAQLEAAIAAGQVVTRDNGVVLQATVLGPVN